MMTSRAMLTTLFTLVLVMSTLFSVTEPTQSKGAVQAPTVTITFPGPSTSRSTIPTLRRRDFTAIRGTFTVPAGCRNTEVKVSIAEMESDLEWACTNCPVTPPVTPIYKWVIGPTGRWLPTTMGTRGNWVAPGRNAYPLPSGPANLPDNRYYVVYAYAEGAPRNQCTSQQVHNAFKIFGN
jgi:hypothetical protein